MNEILKQFLSLNIKILFLIPIRELFLKNFKNSSKSKINQSFLQKFFQNNF